MSGAVAYLLTPDQRRQRDRDAALADLVRHIVPQHGLDANAELDLWRATRVRIEQIVELAEAAVSAQIEFAAHDQRLDQHLRDHYECILSLRCPEYDRMDREFGRLQRERDRRMRALLGGSR